MITISGVPKYKKYVISEYGIIVGGKEFLEESTKKYEYEKLLNDIVTNYAEPIFKAYIKMKDTINYEEFDINNIDKPYVKEEMLQDKKILKIIIKLFNEYGIIADTEDNSENGRNEYVCINELLYLINQLIALYILVIAVKGIEEARKYSTGETNCSYSDLKYKSKLKQIFNYIFYDIKYDSKIYENENEKYYQKCRKFIVEYINKQELLFKKASRKFIYRKKEDKIDYVQQADKILPILWNNYIESLTASKSKKSKTPSICPICHNSYYKTSNRQKRCPNHSRDEICKKEKKEMYDIVVNIDNDKITQLNSTQKRKIEKIKSQKDIRKIKKKELEEILKELEAKSET